MKLLKSLQIPCDVTINDGEQSMKYYLYDASNMHIVGDAGQCHFRQKGSDKNHTGLSPPRITVIRDFVFNSD